VKIRLGQVAKHFDGGVESLRDPDHCHGQNQPTPFVKAAPQHQAREDHGHAGSKVDAGIGFMAD